VRENPEVLTQVVVAARRQEDYERSDQHDTG
jgi:hypothetical protein